MRAPIVALTRDRDGNARSASILRALGARPFLLPAIGVEPPADTEPLTTAVTNLSGFRWIVFTSAHAVTAACGHPAWADAWKRLQAPIRLAAAGPATAARLAEFGMQASVVPPKAGAESLAAAILAADEASSDVRVLWPRSNIAPEDSSGLLAAGGATVVAPVAYRTVIEDRANVPRFVRLLEGGRIAATAFCSPSGARALAGAMPGCGLGLLVDGRVVGSIGPRTSLAVRKLGARVDVESAEHNADALMAALVSRVAHGPAT